MKYLQQLSNSPILSLSLKKKVIKANILLPNNSHINPLSMMQLICYRIFVIFRPDFHGGK